MTTECKASSSEEPGAGIPHAGICAGGARQRASLPRYVIAYADEQGVIVAEYTYDAFGGTIAQSGSVADAFAHRFSTKYYDAETGLYYYGYRFYSPSLHRWLNRDPIEEKGGENLYAFCMNNPIGFFDQHGLYRMLTGSLTHKKDKTAHWPGFQYAREIIRFLDTLNKKTDAKGRKCFNANIGDLVLTPLETVREKISKYPDDVYLISHGGLKVNGKTYEPYTYYWNKKDTVVEGLFIRADGNFTPLSSFGESLNPQNIFGCYLSPHVRKVKTRNTFFQRESSKDIYEVMYIALYQRLKRYESVSECPCVKEIVVYEGELGNAEMTTQRALEKYPIKPEHYYTGDRYNEALANLQNNYK